MERFTRKSLGEKCRVLEGHVRHREYATDEELLAYRPGGPENPGRGTNAWVFWYAQLVRFCGREEVTEQEHESADAAVLDAYRNQPESVELVSLDDSGKRRVLTIHPKGLGALMECHERDWMLGWLATKLAVLRESDRPEHLELIGRTLQEIGRQYAMLAWIASHPGAGIPYPVGLAAGASTDIPEPPEWLLQLEPIDYSNIAHAFSVVNAQRLKALDALTAADAGARDGDRPSWSVFVGSLAIQMKTSPRQLMWDTSLAELLAAIRSHSHAEKEAREKAERDAKVKAPAGRSH